MVNQYSVFDEVQDVVKVGQVSDVDDLPSVEEEEDASDRLSQSSLIRRVSNELAS